MNKMRPIHPGEILKEELDELKSSANKFAKELGIPTNRITGILKGTRSITADTALRLAAFLGTSAEFWLNLQTEYDLKVAELTQGKKIRLQVKHKNLTRTATS